MIGELLEGRSNRTRIQLVSDLADTMIITSICGLGQVASNPISSVIRHFPEDVDRYLNNAKYPGERGLAPPLARD